MEQRQGRTLSCILQPLLGTSHRRALTTSCCSSLYSESNFYPLFHWFAVKFRLLILSYSLFSASDQLWAQVFREMNITYSDKSLQKQTPWLLAMPVSMSIYMWSKSLCPAGFNVYPEQAASSLFTLNSWSWFWASEHQERAPLQTSAYHPCQDCASLRPCLCLSASSSSLGAPCSDL